MEDDLKTEVERLRAELEEYKYKYDRVFRSTNFIPNTNIILLDGGFLATGEQQGTKFGETTDSKMGFYGTDPVDQPATVADPAGGAVIDIECRLAVSQLIDRLQELGLIA